MSELQSYKDEYQVTSQELEDRYKSQDDVGRYLDEINRTPLLNAEQEVDIAKRIEAGLYANELLANEDFTLASKEELEWMAGDGELARNELIEANLRLVVFQTKKQRHLPLEFLDKVQEGNTGLVRAVEKFDYKRGYKFSTYATWWIRQAITRGSNKTGRTVYLPDGVVEEVRSMNKEIDEYRRQHGEDPRPEDLAQQMEWPVEKVIDLLQIRNDPVSLDVPVDEAGKTVLGHLIEDETVLRPDEAVTAKLIKEELMNLMELVLDEREAEIVRHRYGFTGEPQKLSVLAERYELSDTRINQIELKALKKLGRIAIQERSIGRR